MNIQDPIKFKDEAVLAIKTVVSGFTEAATKPYEDILYGLNGNEKLLVQANCESSRNIAKFAEGCLDLLSKKIDEFIDLQKKADEESEARYEAQNKAEEEEYLARIKAKEAKKKAEKEAAFKLDLMSEDDLDLDLIYGEHVNVCLNLDGAETKRYLEIDRNSLNKFKFELMSRLIDRSLRYDDEVLEVKKISSNKASFLIEFKEDDGKRFQRTVDVEIKSIEIVK